MLGILFAYPPSPATTRLSIGMSNIWLGPWGVGFSGGGGACRIAQSSPVARRRVNNGFTDRSTDIYFLKWSVEVSCSDGELWAALLLLAGGGDNKIGLGACLWAFRLVFNCDMNHQRGSAGERWQKGWNGNRSWCVCVRLVRMGFCGMLVIISFNKADNMFLSIGNTIQFWWPTASVCVLSIWEECQSKLRGLTCIYFGMTKRSIGLEFLVNFCWEFFYNFFN